MQADSKLYRAFTEKGFDASYRTDQRSGVMRLFLRIAGACGLACLVANAALAAPGDKSTEYVESGAIPSATANSSFDNGVQQVSDEEPAACAVCGDSCDDCNNNCMSNTCCCYEPTFCVTAGAVFLNRSRPDRGAILTPIGAPGVISDAGDFGFGWNAGPDVTISKQMANGWIWEVRYFNDRDATATANYPGVTGAHVFGINVLGITSLSANYFTTLDTTEINLCRPVNDFCTLLAGFRWVVS
jgi:hypothetical protein